MPAAKPTVRSTSSAIIAGRLRRAIQRGEMAPGTRLRQVDVAQRFGVSTTPVREAFMALQAEGYVRIDPHRGAIVFEPSPEDLWEAYAIRETLERLALARATERITPETARELARLIDEMRATKGSSRWVELNDRFHMTLYRQSGMPRLCALISGLRDASATYMHMRAASHPAGERVDDEHAAILEAVRDGDAARAQQILEGHLRRAVQEITGFLEPPGRIDGQSRRPRRAVASRR